MSSINHSIQELKISIKGAQEIALEMLKQNVEDEIRVAYSRDIVREWDRLENITETLCAIETSLGEIENNLSITGHFLSEPDAEPAKALLASKPSASESHDISIILTEGMIRQNLLTFTRWMEPRGPFKLGDTLTINFNGEKINSDIVSPGNKLRERGAVGRFYRDLHLHEGDSITLKMNPDGSWTAGFFRKPKNENPFRTLF